MSQTPVTAHQYPQISPRAFQHPADRAATAALHQVPMLDTVVGKLIEYGYERGFRQTLLGNSVRLGEGQLPDVWTRYRGVLHTLDIAEVYDLYLAHHPFANAGAIGAGTPMILLNSGLVELLDEEELTVVLAHEAAHILSGHVLHLTALRILLALTQSARVPFLAGLPLMGIRSALLEWQRATELSADRAAAIVTRDPRLACRTLMAVASGMPSSRLDVDRFILQASEYEGWGDGFDRISRVFSEIAVTHSYAVRRVSELLRWVQGGEYDRIVSGEYIRRGQEPDPRAEAGEAADHYAERFRQFFKEAGENVSNIGGSVGGLAEAAGDWLRKRAAERNDPGAGDGDDAA